MNTRAETPKAGVLKRGFTLIELMVVIVILAGLIALVGPNVWNALFQSKKDTARMQIHNFQSAIEQFYLTERKWPRTLDELTQPNKDGNAYMKSVPMDPWRQPYAYNLTNDTRGDYLLTSGGPDGQVGTADDIVFDSNDGKFRGDE